MSYDKDEYEKLISTSPLFFLFIEKLRTACMREVLKMVEYLFCYLMVIN